MASNISTIKSVRMPFVLEDQIQAWLKSEEGKGFTYNGFVLHSIEQALSKPEPEAVQEAPAVGSTPAYPVYSEVLTLEEQKAIAADSNPRYAYKLLLAKRMAASKGGECLSTSYGDTPGRNKKLTWRCAKGHIWETRYALVMGEKSSWCPMCAHDKKAGVL